MKSAKNLQTNLPFINRELSWLEFNKRVLELSYKKDLPLLERAKFLAIFASNLNEFFMIRVAGVKDQISAGVKNSKGESPYEIYYKIREKVIPLYKLQSTYIKKLLEDLKNSGIYINVLIDEAASFAEFLFDQEIRPLITPVTLTATNPMPFIANNRVTICVKIKKNNEIFHSFIIIPENIEKIFFKEIDDKICYLSSTFILKNFISEIFYNFEVLEIAEFKITRDADLTIEEEGAEDLLKTMEKQLDLRKKGKIVRFEVNADISKNLLNFICNKLEIQEDEIYFYEYFSDPTIFFHIHSKNKSFYYPSFTPKIPNNIDLSKSLFQQIKEKPLLLYRPFEDFSIVSKLVKEAAEDENTLAIKMTIYRVNNDSTIVKSLINAAKKGKTVSVIVELKARFDEENNVELAKQLEEAGCIVTYGFKNLKVHSKLLLIVRKENGHIKSYAHMATGNYNEKTARQYTDVDYITAEPDVCEDVMSIFNYLMGYMDNENRNRIFLSPKEIRTKLLALIDEEIKNASQGKKAHIIIKVNSLIDKILMEKLYEASQHNVKIQIIARGICGIITGIKGLSDNITVKSIVGRFLEHPRIFYFHSGGKRRIFITAADFMERNMDRRVETMMEIFDKDAKRKLLCILENNLKDTENSWELVGEKYIKVKSKKKFDCHKIGVSNIKTF